MHWMLTFLHTCPSGQSALARHPETHSRAAPLAHGSAHTRPAPQSASAVQPVVRGDGFAPSADAQDASIPRAQMVTAILSTGTLPVASLARW